MTDNFDFILNGGPRRPFLGYVSQTDKTVVGERTLIRGSKNVYKKRSGTIANRDGMKRRGVPNASLTGTKEAFAWQTSFGVVRHVRVNNSKLQVEYDPNNNGNYAWYDLETGLVNTAFVFNTWWNNSIFKDHLLMTNGDVRTIRNWSGGVTKLASTASVSNSVITASINASGTGYSINDLVTITGGGGTGCVLRVLTVSSGAITGFAFVSRGTGYSNTTGAATTSPGGTSATFNITVGTSYNITKQGTATWIEEGFWNTPIAVSQLSPTSLPSTLRRLEILINGNVYAYTGGADTTTIVGITTNPSSEAVGSIITQRVHSITLSTIPNTAYTVDFFNVLNNQLLVGSYKDKTLYLSADTDFTDFQNGGDFVVGDPDRVILENYPTGIAAKKDNFFVFAGSSDCYVVTPNVLVPIQFTDPFSSSTRYIVTKVEKIPGSARSAAKGQQFISSNGSDIVYLDQNNQLRFVGDFRSQISERFPSLSDHIHDELAQSDMTGGSVQAIDEYVYITAPAEGKEYVLQFEQMLSEQGLVSNSQFWHAPYTRGISRLVVLDGTIYGHSAFTPQVFQLYDTGQYYDDSPEIDPNTGTYYQLPYESIARFGYTHDENRQTLLVFDRTFIEGYIERGTNLYQNVYFNYQGASGFYTRDVNTVNKPAKLYGFSANNSIGQKIISENPLGNQLLLEGNGQDLLPKFMKITLTPQTDSFEYFVEFFSLDAGARWEILTYGTNATASTNLATFLSN